MAKKQAKDIVVDADVARAAGGKEAIHPTPKKCRAFLLAFFDTPHRIAMSPKIREEWDKHQSRFARIWRVKMVATKKFRYVKPVPNIELEDQLISKLNTMAEEKALRKDFHLIEAALVCDKRVVSMDERVRTLFSECAKQVSEIKDIVWVNPINEDETPIEWLLDGALAENNRLLGS